MSDFSSAKVTLAWATRVSLGQLCASLFAYVETKATTTTSRWASTRSKFQSFSSMPEEVKENVAQKLRDMHFRFKMKQWLGICDCLVTRCSMSDHVSAKEIDDHYNAFDGNLDVHSRAHEFMGLMQDRHDEALCHFQSFLMPKEAPVMREISRCIQVRALPKTLLNNWWLILTRCSTVTLAFVHTWFSIQPTETQEISTDLCLGLPDHACWASNSIAQPRA